MFVCLLSLKWEKWQNSDKNCKLVTLTSFTCYAIPSMFADDTTIFTIGTIGIITYICRNHHPVITVLMLNKVYTCCRVGLDFTYGILNSFAPKQPIRNHPCRSMYLVVMSTVFTVKDNFVSYLVQEEEIFQTIPEWAQFSQEGWMKRPKNC